MLRPCFGSLRQAREAGSHGDTMMKHILGRASAFQSGLAITLFFSGLVGGSVALADDDDGYFRPGNLLVSTRRLRQ